MDTCEYCGEPSTKTMEDVSVCDSCYVDNFGYLDGDDEICSVCGDEADFRAAGESICYECFESDPSLTEDDIER